MIFLFLPPSLCLHVREPGVAVVTVCICWVCCACSNCRSAGRFGSGCEQCTLGLLLLQSMPFSAGIKAAEVPLVWCRVTGWDVVSPRQQLL
jgi:hypothetical protein